MDVLRKDNSKRFTSGVLYAPGVVDRHGEWVSEDELRKAVWAFVRSWERDPSGRKLRLQHDEQHVVGEIVEIASLPTAMTASLCSPRGEVRKQTLPAGTVIQGVIWTPEAWRDYVLTGRVTGYSMGGRATRINGDVEPRALVKTARGSLIRRVAQEGSIRLT